MGKTELQITWYPPMCFNGVPWEPGAIPVILGGSSNPGPTGWVSAILTTGAGGYWAGSGGTFTVTDLDTTSATGSYSITFTNDDGSSFMLSGSFGGKACCGG
jgi:hypothetical protein